MTRLPVYYIPHGGGPWNAMEERDDPELGYPGLSAWLVALGEAWKSRAKSLLVISAHWEEAKATAHFGERPGMLYDYGGFPEHTYRLQWPAPGDPALAKRIEGLLSAAGIASGRETARGYDHGTFVPMMVAFPEAQVPVAQLSLVRGLDPTLHFAIGAALEPLRAEGVLIIGSGMSYHNLRALLTGDPSVAEVSKRFDEWLAKAVATEDPDRRRAALLDWEKAPGAREAHPRSEHLVPLFVAAGAGGADGGAIAYSGRLLGARVSAIAFGA